MIAINKDDILPNDEYKIVRNDRRKDLVIYKKKRRNWTIIKIIKCYDRRFI